ncbi:hypothetical protein L6164_017036 [Bauhinia variegata]|uniref:Uncharacterized protein n=1 Tax=Bauhinia variegata TaxID=167791 RepID=A0ACB9N6M5_BAUVA|nr:hypothetical protein L6164_017036 [Bauhinia variegata]
MASSQVEIASSPRFGCVLRDRNRRDGCRDSNARFQKNLKNFVRDHVNNCISISSDSSSDENRRNQINNVDSLAAKNNLANLRFTSNNREKGDESSFGSRKHSKSFDRWAARQAREMVSTTETEAKLLALPNSEPCKSEESPSPSSSRHTRTPSGIPNLAASSLVQIWEKRLNQSNSTKSNASPNNGRSSPNGKSADHPFSVEEQCIEATASGEPAIVSEESFPDYESDKTCSLQRQDSDDSAESDRVRVADIIKRLTASDDSNDHEQSSNIMGSPSRERERTPTPEVADYRVFPQVTTPRLRGRLAFHDLLMQIHRDRHRELDNLVERASVSKFTQRGRIQSLLKLKLLQRGVAVAHGQSRQRSTLSPVSRHSQGSSIMQLRERFIMSVEHGSTSQAEVSEQRIPRSEIANNITQLDNSKKYNQLKKDTPLQIVPSTDNQSTAPTQNSVTRTRADDNKDEARPSSDVTSQVTCSKAKTIDSPKTAETTPAKEIADAGKEQNATAETSSDDTLEDSSYQQNATAEPSYDDTIQESNYQQNATAENSYDDITEDEEASYQQYAESGYDDEVDASEHNYDETSYDWMSQISRPRSYWEDQRKAWYREVLDAGSHNEEIRQLLERRTVSTYLASDFRGRMDRLMVSHIDTQTHLACSSQDDDEDRRGRMVQLIAFLQEHLHPAHNHEEDGEERGVEKAEEVQEQQEEEEESSQYTNHDVNDYYNQSSSPSSSLLRTWSYRDNETGDESDRVASPSSPQPSQSHSSPSQSSYQDNRQYSSSANHHSIEMELICDLRSQMDQLHQEMSELRKSIKSCIDMQMMLQKSMMNREAYTVKNEEKESHDRKRKKGNCCICYEKKVDSLLYRCGHMCACIKCANELQWNGGKCPICRAPILDVVRVYVDS